MAVATQTHTFQKLDAPAHGTKRSRIEYEAAVTSTTYSIHASPSPSPTPDHLEHFQDDNDHEYEFVRVPKKRDWDLFRVARRQPEDREQAELPLTATKPDGTRVTMWSQMDTGAAVNTVNRSTLEALFGVQEARKRMREITEIQFDTMGDSHFGATHSVDLCFTTGVSRKIFDKVNFIVVEDDAKTANTDGMPNVLLGLPFLQENSMLMIDVEYVHDAEKGLEVIAERYENEKEGAAGIRPIKMATKTAGFQRPVRR